MIANFPGDGSLTHHQTLRNYLARFGLGGGDLPDQRVYTLSGGQKTRLCLALAMYRKPHALIADEISNHVDVGAWCIACVMRRNEPS